MREAGEEALQAERHSSGQKSSLTAFNVRRPLTETKLTPLAFPVDSLHSRLIINFLHLHSKDWACTVHGWMDRCMSGGMNGWREGHRG